MNIFRASMVLVPLLVVSSTAFADSEDKKKSGAMEPQTPIEEPKAEETTPQPSQQPMEQPMEQQAQEQPAAPPVYTPPPTPPPVATTTTTAYEQRVDVVEKPAEKPAWLAVGDRFSIEPLVGLGTNSWNFGVGGRMGYTFKIPIYLGATFMWHNGDTNTIVGPNAITETKSNFYYPGAELGYDIGIGRGGLVMVRPYGGAAILFDRERVSVNGVARTNTDNQFMVYPGLTARLNIPRSPVYFGADTRLMIPVENGGVSYQGFLLTGLNTM